MIKARYAGQPKANGQAGGAASGKVGKKRSIDAAKSLAPIVTQARDSGSVSPADIAEYFNRIGIRARRGGPWSPSMIRSLIGKIEQSS